MMLYKIRWIFLVDIGEGPSAPFAPVRGTEYPSGDMLRLGILAKRPNVVQQDMREGRCCPGVRLVEVRSSAADVCNRASSHAYSC